MNDTQAIQTTFDEGVHAFVQNDIDTSVEKFSRVIEEDANYRLAHVSRGAAYLRLERVDDALADFDRAVEIDPSHAKAYHLRGLAYAKQGKNEQALENFNRAIELDPEYGAAYYSRSTIQSHLGHHDAAFDDIQMYTALTEQNVQAFANENNIWRSQHLRVESDGAADPMYR